MMDEGGNYIQQKPAEAKNMKSPLYPTAESRRVLRGFLSIAVHNSFLASDWFDLEKKLHNPASFR
jgi:hypothetical protein